MEEPDDKKKHALPFVILHHDWPADHWDFMVDLDGISDQVATWSLEQKPGAIPIRGRAEKLADHRRDYLNYEGPVSGGRGSVHRLIFGDCIFLEHGAEIEFELRGQADDGSSILAKLKLHRQNGHHVQSQFNHRIDAQANWEFDWTPYHAAKS